VIPVRLIMHTIAGRMVLDTRLVALPPRGARVEWRDTSYTMDYHLYVKELVVGPERVTLYVGGGETSEERDLMLRHGWKIKP
jgi:hypothetical protein